MNRRHLLIITAATGLALPVVAFAEPSETPPAPVTARQWQVVELTLAAQREYDHPFDFESVRLVVTFEGPGAEQLEVPGFWDGKQTWKVRFTPTKQGTWKYVTAFSVQDDPGLHGRRGTIHVLPPDGENPLFRHGGLLKVSPNGRHLTYTDGTPFFWLGDTWWFCPSTLVPFEGSSNPACSSMFRKLIDLRAKQRFTVVQMCFLGPPRFAPGLEGFSVLKPDSWQPQHVVYWQEVDRYIRYANQQGIIPVVGMAFHRSTDAVSLDALKKLWAYFLARYGAMPVGVLIQGEYNLKQGPVGERVEKVLRLGQFIKECDPYKRALTVHPWYYGGDQRQAWDQPWYDFIMVQGGHSREGPPPKFYLEVYNRKQSKPLLEGECTYEGIYGYDAAVVRRNAYKAIQSGSFGYTYGSHGLWYPNQTAEDQKFDKWGKPIPWWQALQRPGGAQMEHLRACYESVDWWKLAPRPGAIVPACSILTKAEGDNTFLLYFVADSEVPPGGRMTGVKGGAAYVGQWFDPRTGRVRPASARLVAEANGLVLPERPDAQDWMLVLKRQTEP